MAFTLKIDTDNAAFYNDSDGNDFDPGPELARILRNLADALDAAHDRSQRRRYEP